MAPYYGWGSTASRLQPLRGGRLGIQGSRDQLVLTYIKCFTESVLKKLYGPFL